MAKLVSLNPYSWITWKNCLWTLLPRFIIATGCERPWCAISRRYSWDRPPQVVVSKGWITGVRRSDGGGRWRQRVVGFIHQTFSSSKYHRVVLVPRYVSTREIVTKSISRNAHCTVAFKNPQDQLGARNLLLQAFPTYWQDMMDVHQKVAKWPFEDMVLDLHPRSEDRKPVFSHLLMHKGYPHWHRRKREAVSSLSKMVY